MRWRGDERKEEGRRARGEVGRRRLGEVIGRVEGVTQQHAPTPTHYLAPPPLPAGMVAAPGGPGPAPSSSTCSAEACTAGADGTSHIPPLQHPLSPHPAVESMALGGRLTGGWGRARVPPLCSAWRCSGVRVEVYGRPLRMGDPSLYVGFPWASLHRCARRYELGDGRHLSAGPPN